MGIKCSTLPAIRTKASTVAGRGGEKGNECPICDTMVDLSHEREGSWSSRAKTIARRWGGNTKKKQKRTNKRMYIGRITPAPSNGNMQPTSSFTTKTIAPIATTTKKTREGFHLLLVQANVLVEKSSRPALATTARSGGDTPRGTAEWLSPRATNSHDMWLVVRRLQERGRERKAPLTCAFHRPTESQ